MLSTMALLRLFGHPVLESDGTQSALRVPAKAIALLSVLVANHMRPVSREWLAEKLWPDCDVAEARANLRRHLHLASKALGDDVFLISRQTVQWNTACALNVDVIRFDRSASANPVEAIEQYTGLFCAGLEDETLTYPRAAYEDLYADCLRRALADARAADDKSALIRYLHRSVAHDPLDETAVRELMKLRFEIGDRAGALRTYNELADQLHREIDAAPAPQTCALFERILYDTSSSGVATNISAPRTSLLGREIDMEAVSKLLQKARVVSLVGPGGIGKTRLAIATALANLQTFPAGVWLAELAYASDAETVLRSILAAAAMQGSGQSGLDAFTSKLGRQRVLLLLDNCEHVREEISAIVSSLLTSTNATILATSRRKLGIATEAAYEVQGLQVPASREQSAQSLRAYSAARLFVDRACHAAPELRLTDENAGVVAEIVSRLDGIPLAIELVAARSNMLTLDGMRKRITSALSLASRNSKRTATSRHTTMDQALRWSYDLLTEREQLLFRRLYVFPAQWDLDACEAICSDEQLAPHEVLAVLSELLDASLVISRSANEAVHYMLLQPIRQFSESLSAQSAEREELLRRHARYYIALAQKHDDQLEAHGESYLRAMVGAEENLRLALRTASTWKDVSGAASLLIAASPYWGRSAQHGEIAHVMSRLLEADRFEQLDRDTRARLLRAAGRFAFGRGEWADAIRLDLQSARAFEDLGKPYNALMARLAANIAAAYTGTPLEERIQEHKRILARVEELCVGPPWIAGELQSDLSSMYKGLRQTRTALEHALSGLNILRTHRRRDREGMLLTITARIYQDLGEVDKSLECAREGVRIFTEIGEESTLGEAYRNLALAQMAADAPAADVFSTLLRALELHASRQDARFTLYAVDASVRACVKYGFMRAAARALGHVLTLKERARYNRLTDPIPEESVRSTIEQAVGSEFAGLVSLGRLDTLADLQAAMRAIVEGASTKESDKQTIAS